jgi:hypothetical protein
MSTINQIKQSAEADTPLLLFRCVLLSGTVCNWSSHSVTFNGEIYSPRVLGHNLFDLQLSADDAMDGISQLSLSLANADSTLSEVNAAYGFKGAQLTVYFVFADLTSFSITTESTVLFRGIAGDPDEITEDTLSLSFTNKLSLTRIPVPEVRIQRSCPWNFPSTPEQRAEAKDGGTQGKYSRFVRCGYSAGVDGGCGNLNGGTPFTSCDKSRAQCQQRGMFDHDQSGTVTRRYGGFEFVPSAVLVRTSGDKTSHLSPLLDNSAKFNDPVPLVYGTGWLKAPVIFARNDGNLTHIDVLLGLGPISTSSPLKVVVNDIEIPAGVSGQDMTGTGWYSEVTDGSKQGNFNLGFVDTNGNPLGDPYGSLAVLSIIVPNRISSGTSLPTVEVLLQGLMLDVYDGEGQLVPGGPTYTNNPAWVILDILRRCGWSTSDIDLRTFFTAAAFCQEVISTTDLNSNSIRIPRYESNVILTKRQSAAAVVRGIRVASSLMLRYGASGLLELLPETTVAAQQPNLPDGSNSTEQLDGGWPAYEFSDGSAPFSGIARRSDGGSSVRVLSRSIAETSNRLSVEFQDESNEYQQDSLSLVHSDDLARIGHEISSQSTALGIANFSQATRVLLRQLDKSIDGNTFVEFQTSFRALRIRPGDLIALTYVKEGYLRIPFRVVKISPSMNYEMVTIQAQIHDDDWYSDDPAVLGGAGRQPRSQVQTPRPLIGTVRRPLDEGKALECFDFGVTEAFQAQADGTALDILTVSFSQPARPKANSTSLPLLSLAPVVATTGGAIAGGSNFYYAVSAVGADGQESNLSFTVPVTIPTVSDSNTVSITNLSLPAGTHAVNVYRGNSPQMLYRIASGIGISDLASDQNLGLMYTDTGAVAQPIGPPDQSFDHANFYYRYEYAGPCPVTIASGTTVGWEDLSAPVNAYVGRTVRIIDGEGRGQERLVVSNTSSVLSVNPAWSRIPDGTSVFVVTDGAWKFAAVSQTSPVQFEISYQAGTSIEITGRAANVNNKEGFPELCPVTRWALGGGRSDVGVAAAPSFSLAVTGMTPATILGQDGFTNTGGDLILYQVGFNDLTNAGSVSSGTLQVLYWNELDTPSRYALSNAMDTASDIVSLQQMPSVLPQAGSMIQVGTELMSIIQVDAPQKTYRVKRHDMGSPVSEHAPGDLVLHLQMATTIVPFAPGFFANKASINYIHPIRLPDVRVGAAQFYATNAFGNGLTTQNCYTTLPDGGLRTLSGGQFSLQSSGNLATQQSAAPPLVVESSHAVRDIRATLGAAATGYKIMVDLLQNGTPYASLAIASGDSMSSITGAPKGTPVNGVNLPPLTEGATITMNTTLQVPDGYDGALDPGRDLTVTIRL